MSNIISNDGKWRSYPSILKGTINLYEPVDERLFLNKLRELGVALPSNRIFENLMEYRDELEIFFGCHNGNKTIRRKAEAIRYCKYCIHQSIREAGFGFLKLNWLFDSMCFVHNKPLKMIPVSTRNKALAALRCVYRGENPDIATAPIHLSLHQYKPKEVEYESNSDLIAPCLAGEFENFIKVQRLTFSIGVLKRLGHSISQPLISESYLTQANGKRKIFKALQAENDPAFQCFMKSTFESKMVFTGVIDKKGMKENLYKNRGSNCMYCSYSKCIANLAIIRPRQDTRLIERCELNYWIINDFLKNNEFVSGKSVGQTSLKEKKKIIDAPIEHEFLKRYKSALDNAKYGIAEPYLRWPAIKS
ncbi:hypothetical protein [Pseudoalteromonas sp. MMG022]|uniref:hypothetical protein n=1 Tax=Pseudoalteromonas sp. MMG022 TaxID=2909978 RepID=UPI001F228CC2|nr:hypothetical protein [Pseudoalteromonas sp. MMG022]MCF6437187.1 hypothetical protein [Pseudoalteromonas sp. MMG022]